MTRFPARIVAAFLIPWLMADSVQLATPLMVSSSMTLDGGPLVKRFTSQALADSLVFVHPVAPEPACEVRLEAEAVLPPSTSALVQELSKIKERFSLDVVMGYERIARQLAELIHQRLPEGGIVLIDGVAGAGKTTLSKFLQVALWMQRQRYAEHVQGDISHGSEAEHKKYVDEVVSSKVEVLSARQHASRVFRFERLNSVLETIVRLVGSEGPLEDQKIVRMNDAWQKGQREFIQKEWIFRRNGIALFDFAYALYCSALIDGGHPGINFRVMVNPDDATKRWASRGLEFESNQVVLQRRTIFHKLGSQPARKLYQAETETWIDIQIDLRGNPLDWKLTATGRFKDEMPTNVPARDFSLTDQAA